MIHIFEVIVLLTFIISTLGLETRNEINVNSLDVKAFPSRKVVCYFGSWAVYRSGQGQVDVESIDPFLCTHVIFSFAGLRNGEISILDPYNDVCEEWGQGAMKRFTNLKNENPNLITMLAIGGWNEGSEQYSKMAKTPEGRKKFIDSVVGLLERFDFDGFDLDWEYPAARGGVPSDKENFSALLKEMRAEFDKHQYQLSAAISAGEATIKAAYSVRDLTNYLDFINVMAYDFHGAWDMKTGHHSPMYKSPLDPDQFEVFNVNHSIHFLISEGAQREKLILGMGLYGRGFLLDKESEHGLYAPSQQPINPGMYTREAGLWGYNEICESLKDDGQWIQVNDPNLIAPYAFNKRQWIGFDDVESIKYKSRYIVNMGLGGGMVWSLDTDDFNAKCHEERFPLIKTIYREIIGAYPKYAWEPKPSRSTTKAVCRGMSSEATAIPVTTPVVDDIGVTSTQTPAPGICASPGIIEDPSDCTKFINCVKVDDGFIGYTIQCGAGTAFSKVTMTCTHASDVPNCPVTTISFNRQGSI